MGAVERRATVDGDVTLAYAEQGPDGPVAAVFLPGWPDPWRSFELVMAQLPAEVRALALSHRGCGDSDRGVGHSANWEAPLEVAGVVASLVRGDGS